MGTPTWVRHVQETEWSFHEWHSSCPVRTAALPLVSLHSPVHARLQHQPELRARSPHVAGARSLGDGSPAAAALGVRAGIGARARLPPAGFCQTGTRVGARGAGEAQPATRRAAGLMPMAGHDRPSDRWTAVRGTCRRLPDDRPRRSPGVDQWTWKAFGRRHEA